MRSNSALHCVCTRPLYTLATLVCVAFQKATLRFSGAKRCATHGNPTREVLREMSRDEARHDLSEMFRKEEVRSGSSSSGGGGGSGVGKGGDNLLHTAGGSGFGEHTQSGGDTIAEDDKVLVVLGGSLGAAAINTAMRGAISMLLPDDATYTPGGSGGSAHGARDWSERPNAGGRMWVVWQAGASGFDALRAAVPPHPRLLLTPFIDRMEVAYGAADLAVARAGAITCSELLATRTPSVLVPSPNVAEDHQTFNALEMESAGAAVMVREAHLSSSSSSSPGGIDGVGGAHVRIVLEHLVASLLGDAGRLAAMSAAAAAHDTPQAAEDIANDVARLAEISLHD
mmetsp:Transcript_14086/g.23109  ORF Transcript_14086/g.23109 Transcript_14086/m.23109 type:complete len:342 (+) Transcript_14086:502-1527(+)